MVRTLPLLALLLAACSQSEPERPSEGDEARFDEIAAMLDEEAADDTQEERAASEDATPSKD